MAALRSELEDPALYLLPEGAGKAAELGKQLDQARAELDLALKRWEAAGIALEGTR